MNISHLHEQYVNGRTKACTDVVACCDLLDSILDSTDVGILVVSVEGLVLYRNWCFVKMWDITSDMYSALTNAELLESVKHKLIDPDVFAEGVASIYANPTTGVLDRLYLKDGRIFDRAFFPLVIESEIVGSIWNFRDVTEVTTVTVALTATEKILENLQVKDKLTNREFQVFQYLKYGCTSKDTADKLCVSKRTVDAHRASIMLKLGLKSMSELAKKLSGAVGLNDKLGTLCIYTLIESFGMLTCI